MSIIFEALRKIEEGKGEGSAEEFPLAFPFDEGQPHSPSEPRRRRRLLLWAGLIGFPVAVAAFILFVPDWLGVPSGGPEAPSAVSPVSAVPSILKAVSLEPKSIRPFVPSPPRTAPPEPRADGRGARSESEIKLPDLRLKGVSHSTRRAWAFINDRMMKAGDTIEGAKLVEILDDRVRLEFKGVEFTLTH